MKKFKINDLEELHTFTKKNKELFNTYNCYAFKGEMGVGKTTLIQLLLKEFGIVNLQGSPTYAIINEYQNEKTNRLYYHLDCYRLKNDYEAFELGLEELSNEKTTIFIEWPEKVLQFLPLETRWITIQHKSDDTRTIEIDYEHGS